MRDSTLRLSQWIEHWSATTLEASSRKPSTKQLYRLLARKHLCPAPLGTAPLDRLRKSDIDGLLVKLRRGGLSDSTVRQVYTILRQVLDDARLDGLIASNPATRVPRPRVGRTDTLASLASALVAHRAERLVRAAELTAGGLDALENGALQLSAVATRALFELAVVCWHIHQPLLEPWRSVHGSVSRVRAAASSDDFETFQLLWDTRIASRFYDKQDGWPNAKSVLTQIDHLNRKVKDARHVYAMLCDATHPNVEANATLWRTEYASLDDHRAIRFAPGESNSVIKEYIISVVCRSLLLIISFARDLWWVAADITTLAT